MPGNNPWTAVIDYQTGNSRSVSYALDHLGIAHRLVRSPSEATDAERFILPGVGAAGTTMRYLAQAGWPDFLTSKVLGERVPFLGICVGLQVLFEHSEEQNATCLGWLPGKVMAFDAAQVRVPHIGWNRVTANSDHFFVRQEASPNSGVNGVAGDFYFVNSYYAMPVDEGDIGGFSSYGKTKFASIVAHENIMATQFHAEKSGPLGLSLLARFASFTTNTVERTTEEEC